MSRFRLTCIVLSLAAITVAAAVALRLCYTPSESAHGSQILREQAPGMQTARDAPVMPKLRARPALWRETSPQRVWCRQSSPGPGRLALALSPGGKPLNGLEFGLAVGSMASTWSFTVTPKTTSLDRALRAIGIRRTPRALHYASTGRTASDGGKV